MTLHQRKKKTISLRWDRIVIDKDWESALLTSASKFCNQNWISILQTTKLIDCQSQLCLTFFYRIAACHAKMVFFFCFDQLFWCFKANRKKSKMHAISNVRWAENLDQLGNCIHHRVYSQRQEKKKSFRLKRHERSIKFYTCIN